MAKYPASRLRGIQEAKYTPRPKGLTTLVTRVSVTPEVAEWLKSLSAEDRGRIFSDAHNSGKPQAATPGSEPVAAPQPKKLTQEQRQTRDEQITALYIQGSNRATIAKQLGVSLSTVDRVVRQIPEQAIDFNPPLYLIP